MDFDELEAFVETSMRMSHIYQPVMLMTLLKHGGVATVRQIASDILAHDESQIAYYESIIKEMVGRVLRNRTANQSPSSCGIKIRPIAAGPAD